MSNHFENSLPYHCVKNLDEVNRLAAIELTRVSKWMSENSTQQIEIAKKEKDRKTMSDEVKLIAGHPASKPFWADHNKTLHCFTCDFTQQTLKSYEQELNLPWMTKRIKKNDSDLVISFCPACMSGEPWIVHFKNSFTAISIAPKERKPEDPLVTIKNKKKVDDTWLDLPPDVPHYRNTWTSSDFFEKPYDWREQESRYDVQKKAYEVKKGIYNAFCAEKIAQIPPIISPTMNETVQRIEKERLSAFREKFAQRSTKRHNICGFLPDSKLKKKQDENNKHPFNSPPPAYVTCDNKENLQI